MPHFCYTIDVTAYNRIFDEAIENYGLVTTSMARRLGIAPGTLVDLAYRGRLMLNLAPTDPDRIYVATASRVRKNLGEGIKICKAVVGYKPIRVEGIPSQKVVDAILSARATMPNDRLK